VAYFKIGLDFSDDRLNEILEKAFGAADRLDKKVDELQTQLNKGFQSGNAGKLASEIDKGAKAATSGTKSLREMGAAAGLAFGAFNLGVGIVQGVGASIGDFATNTISLAGAAESAEANFTTFLGSAEAAKNVLKDLNKFAADTPFTQTQINGVAQSLVAFGVEAEDLKPTLQTLGDLSGGNAEKFGDLARIFGQAKTTTKLYTEDLNQLAERGIPVLQELAKQQGTTEASIRKLASEGKIGFTDLEKAFASLTSEGGKFFGLMARQSQTFEGLKSTLQGNFEQLQAGIGQVLLPSLKELVISTNDIISSIDTSNFKEVGFDLALSFEQFGDRFTPVIEAIRSGFGRQILPALREFADTAERVFSDVSGLFSELGSSTEVTAFLQAAIDALSTAFARLVDAVSFVIGATTDLVEPVINALIPAFKSVVSAGTAIISTFSDLAGSSVESGSAFKTFGSILGGVASAIGFVAQLIAEGVKGIVGFGDAAQSANPVIRAFGTAVDFLAAPWRALAGLIRDGAAALADFLGLTESDGEKQARLAEENSKRIAKTATDQRDAYEAAKDLRNEDTAGEKKAAVEKAKVRAEADEKAKAAREKQKKIDEDLAKDRAALQLALITDETQRQILAENARFEEQKKQTQTLFKGREELNGLIEKATILHKKNLAEIGQKAADEQAKVLEEQAKLRLSLIGDETAKAVAVEEVRYKDQLALLVENFAGTQELKGLVEEAERQHQKNIDKIQFDAAAKRIADDAGTQKALAESQVKLLEESQTAYLLQLEKGGASEEEIAKAREAFQLVSQRIRLENEIAYQQAILQTVSAGDEAQRKEIEAQIAVLQAQLGNVNFKINTPDDIGEKGILDKILNLKSSIAKALKIEPGEFDALVGGVVDTAGKAFGALTAKSDAEIAKNQQVIDSINERITKQQEAVDEEKAAAEAGYANDLSIEQARLDGLLKQREDAETKARQLREKALRLQLLQDTAQQISNTAVSVTNIIKNTSTIPFVGILLAAIQIGSLFALLSSSRQKAKAEAASNKFFQGGRIPYFRSDENGATGNRIEGTNLEVGGGEFILNRRATEEHQPFMERLNKGEFKGVDLNQVLSDVSPYSTEKGRNGISEMPDIERVLTGIDGGAEAETKQRAKEFAFQKITEQMERQVTPDGRPLMDVVLKGVQVPQINYSFMDAPATHAARANTAVTTLIQERRDDQSGKIIEAVTQQTNELIRRGLLPLQQLGHRVIDAEGNITHYSTDPSGNTRTSKKIK